MNILRKLPVFSIIILLFFSCICIYLRSIDHLYIFDEVAYFYHQGNGSPIRTVADVISSQYEHFFTGNARVPVHVLIQLFSGVWGPDIFFVVNALMFGALIIVTMMVCTNGSQRRNYLLWLICLFAVLNMFPELYWIWTSINLAPNYMWPCVAVGGLYIFFERVKRGKPLGRYKWIAVPTALLAGWSHEGIGIPLAGAFGLYWLTHRKTVTTDFWRITIPLWIGTLLVMSSPHLYQRFAIVSKGITQNWWLFDIAYIVYSQIALMVFVLLWIIGWCINRKSAYTFVRTNQIYIYSALLSGGFICFAQQGMPRCMMLGGYAGLILMMRFIAHYIPTVHNASWRYGISAVLTLLFAFQQIQVVRYTRKFEDRAQQTVKDWQESTTGEVAWPATIVYPWYVEPSMWDDSRYFEQMFPGAWGVQQNKGKPCKFTK